jgi:uncharacterized protein (TIGR00299 family) protein
MRIAYFDCFSGASGDMILGALVDAGVSARGLRAEIDKINLPGIRLRIRKVLKRGVAGTQVIVEGEKGDKPHRNLKEMEKMINRSGLTPRVKEESREILRRIASVEAEIHQKEPDEIHFHELGGLDSIVDIAGSVWGLHQIGADEIHVSKINVGGGFVKCEHGTLPVPAPATLALMKGKPLYSTEVDKELLTPTGAAILTSMGSAFGRIPSMNVEKVGYGAGRSDLPHPNLLRLILGTSTAVSGREKVVVVETNIDDMNPQFYDYVLEKLFGMEALDVFLTPVVMKKSRPAALLTIVTVPEKLSGVIEFLLRETTTLGLRWREEDRAKTDREITAVGTKYGKIRFKVARWEGKVVNVSPEYEDCKRLALQKGISLKEIFDEAGRTAISLKTKG